jgi:hypothetical protein
MKTKIVLFFLFLSSIVIGQTKVGGKVTDEFGDPVAFANVIFTILILILLKKKRKL